MKWTEGKKKKTSIRADLLWKELLESFLYSALEIFYPELYAAVDLSQPPIFLNRELRIPGLHKANKEEKILDLLMDVPLKRGDLLRILLHVEVQGAGTQEPFHIRMHNYACAITLVQKRPFAALAIRTTPKGQAEQLVYEWIVLEHDISSYTPPCSLTRWTKNLFLQRKKTRWPLPRSV
jgi:hypothetical protein